MRNVFRPDRRTAAAATFNRGNLMKSIWVWEGMHRIVGACIDVAAFVVMCVMYAALTAGLLVVVGLIALGTMLMDALDTARGVRRSS